MKFITPPASDAYFFFGSLMKQSPGRVCACRNANRVASGSQHGQGASRILAASRLALRFAFSNSPASPPANTPANMPEPILACPILGGDNAFCSF